MKTDVSEIVARSVEKPAAGGLLEVRRYGEEQTQALALGFEPSEAQVEREGLDLVFHFADGAEVHLPGFFATGGKPLPEFVLADGTRVAGADFLAALNSELDVETALGDTIPPSSGGLNEWGDAGDLLGGIDRLGTQDGVSWSNAGNAAARPLAPAAMAGPGGDASEAGLPGSSSPEVEAPQPLEPEQPTPEQPAPERPVPPSPALSLSLIGLDEDQLAPGNAWEGGREIALGRAEAANFSGEAVFSLEQPAEAYLLVNGQQVHIGRYEIDPSSGQITLRLLEELDQSDLALINSLKGGQTYNLSGLSVSAVGAGDQSAANSGTVSVEGINDAPAFIGQLPQPAARGEDDQALLESGSLQAADAENDALTFSMQGGLPEGPNSPWQVLELSQLVSYTDANGQQHENVSLVVAVVRLNTQTGQYEILKTEAAQHLNDGLDFSGQVIFEVTDGQLSDSHGFNVVINGANDAPVFESVPADVTVDKGADPTMLQGNLVASDLDSTGLTFSLQGGVSEGQGSPWQVMEFRQDVTYTDADGSVQNESVVVARVRLNTQTGQYEVLKTPAAEHLGQDNDFSSQVVFQVSDGDKRAEHTVNIGINGENSAPLISGIDGQGGVFSEDDFTSGSINGELSSQVVANLSASDVDGGELSFGFADGQGGLTTADQPVFVTINGQPVQIGSYSIDPASGVVTFNPLEAVNQLQHGVDYPSSVSVVAQDREGAVSVPENLEITFQGTNDQPAINVQAAPGSDFTVFTDKQFLGENGQMVHDKTANGVIEIQDVDNALTDMVIRVNGQDQAADSSGEVFNWNLSYGTLSVWFEAAANNGQGEWKFTYTATSPTKAVVNEEITFQVDDGAGSNSLAEQKITVVVDGTNTRGTKDYVEISLDPDRGYASGSEQNGKIVFRTEGNDSMSSHGGTVLGNVLVNDATSSGLPFDGTNLKVTSYQGIEEQGQLTYGTIKINPDGTWEYSLDPEKVRHLGTSDTAVESVNYTYEGEDGTPHSGVLEITIHGQNEAPTFINKVGTDGLVLNATVGAEIDLNLGARAYDVNTKDVLEFNFPGAERVEAEFNVDMGEAIAANTDLSAMKGGLHETDWQYGDGQADFAVPEGAYATDYGWVYQGADGAWHYLVDYSNPEVIALQNSTETLTDRIQVEVSDGQGGLTTGYVDVIVKGKPDGALVRQVYQESGRQVTDKSDPDTPYNKTVEYTDLKYAYMDEDGVYTLDMGSAYLHGNAYSVIGQTQVAPIEGGAGMTSGGILDTNYYRTSMKEDTNFSGITNSSNVKVQLPGPDGKPITVGLLQVGTGGQLQFNSYDPTYMANMLKLSGTHYVEVTYYVYGKDGSKTETSMQLKLDFPDDPPAIEAASDTIVGFGDDFDPASLSLDAQERIIEGQIKASDPEGGKLSFSIAGGSQNPDGSWSIDLDYGRLTVDQNGKYTYTATTEQPLPENLDQILEKAVVQVSDGNNTVDVGLNVYLKGEAGDDVFEDSVINTWIYETGANFYGELLPEDGPQGTVLTTGSYILDSGIRLLINADGTYEVFTPKLFNDPATGEQYSYWSSTDKFFQDKFSYQVMDQDGVVHEKELTINMAGKADSPPTFSYWDKPVVTEGLGGGEQEYLIGKDILRLAYDPDALQNQDMKIRLGSGASSSKPTAEGDWSAWIEVGQIGQDATADAYMNGMLVGTIRIVTKGLLNDSSQAPKYDVYFTPNDNFYMNNLESMGEASRNNQINIWIEAQSGGSTVSKYVGVALATREASALDKSAVGDEQNLAEGEGLFIDVLAGAKHTVGEESGRGDAAGWNTDAMPVIEGKYGKLVWNEGEAKYEYQLYEAGDKNFGSQDARAYIEGLMSGESVKEVFNVTLTDQRGETANQKVEITINGQDSGVEGMQVLNIQMNEHQETGFEPGSGQVMNQYNVQLPGQTADNASVRYAVEYFDGNTWVKVSLDEPFITQYGTLTVNAGGYLTFTPSGVLPEGATGTEGLRYNAYYVNKSGDIVEGGWHEINIGLTGDNDAPVLYHDYKDPVGTELVSGSVRATDVDREPGEELFFFLTDAEGLPIAGLEPDANGWVSYDTGHGQFSLNTVNGAYTYQADSEHLGDIGADVVYVSATDKGGSGATAQNPAALTFHAHDGEAFVAQTDHSLVSGGEFDDILRTGGYDNVILVGGEGQDFFTWTGQDVSQGELNIATILDFDHQEDVLDLRGLMESFDRDGGASLTWDEAARSLTVAGKIEGQETVQQINFEGAIFDNVESVDDLSNTINILLKNNDMIG